MARDTQILRAATVAAPKDYPIDKNVELILRTVHANFKDNGAGGDWLPCVDLISDSGHTIARCVDPNVVVTAGDDAEVTWFPDVKPSAASTPASTALAYATAFRDFGDGAQSVADGTQVSADLPHATTTDAAIMAWATTVNPNDTLDLLAHGTYLAFWDAHWITSDPNGVSIIMTNGVAGIPHNPWVPDGNPLNGASAGQATSQDYNIMRVASGGNTFRFEHSNQTGGLRFVQQAYASVVYLGTG